MVKYQRAALDGVFAALADPTRRAMVERLARSGATPTELAAPFDLTLPAISKHLRVLSAAGLVARRREGRRQHYQLRPAPLQGATDWLAAHRAFWKRRLDALARFLGESQPEEKRPCPRPIPRRRSPSASPAGFRTPGKRSSGPGRTGRR